MARLQMPVVILSWHSQTQAASSRPDPVAFRWLPQPHARWLQLGHPTACPHGTLSPCSSAMLVSWPRIGLLHLFISSKLGLISAFACLLEISSYDPCHSLRSSMLGSWQPSGITHLGNSFFGQSPHWVLQLLIPSPHSSRPCYVALL